MADKVSRAEQRRKAKREAEKKAVDALTTFGVADANCAKGL